MADNFQIKDSGKREQFASGMVRDTSEGKTDFTLIYDGPMLERWAEHLTKGAKKYDARNWMKAEGDEELQRFRVSAVGHFVRWLQGKRDEDHAAAIFFNINGAEYVKARMELHPTDDIQKWVGRKIHWFDNAPAWVKVATPVVESVLKAPKFSQPYTCQVEAYGLGLSPEGQVWGVGELDGVALYGQII